MENHKIHFERDSQVGPLGGQGPLEPNQLGGRAFSSVERHKVGFAVESGPPCGVFLCPPLSPLGGFPPLTGGTAKRPATLKAVIWA